MPVNILSLDVIAKIAAGEVVDRPGSVVKELLENSIDAGAQAIEIHLKDAGKELIHIKDDGCGIAKADLPNLFHRHATSKILHIDDLAELRSMGFRGEALYSIAAVSDVTLNSQTRGQAEAWSIQVRGGKRLRLDPKAITQPGTDIQIAELFFNTPARRKFLKSNTSEMNHILGAVIPYTLMYPEKKFLLTHAGRALLDLKPAGTRKDRVAAVLGLDQNHLLETSQDLPPEEVSIKAILGNINVQRPRRDMQYIFINQRPVESKSLNFAVNDMYRAILPPGVYPAFMLDIRLDPARVDVNIHPSKREVRIKDEATLSSLVRHLTEYTLMRFGNPRTLEHGLPADKIIFGPGQIRQTNFFKFPVQPNAVGVSEPTSADLFGSDDSLQTKFAHARFIGAFINKYLLFEEGTSLFLVDQHAAQERIMFEKFQKQIEAGTIEVQPLLTPVLLKLSAQERTIWHEAEEKIKDVGIETALFDEDTLAVHTQPLLLNNIENAVRTLLGGDDIARCDRSTIARRACKASIVTGDTLSPQQADYQRQQLLACQDPYTCPHGRPTVIELKENFLDRQFLR